jgi:glutathione S-transferase
MDDGFTLHGSPHSLPTYRIALMMRLCRTSFTLRYVSFQRGMHQTPEFRALSRWGQGPVLEHDGRVLVQSAAILEYLAETLGQFGAADIEDRQHLREWSFWDADRLMPPLYAWYSAELGRRKLLPIAFDPVLLAEFDRKGGAALNILDSHLSGHCFLVGDGPTIADICCCSAERVLPRSERRVASSARVDLPPIAQVSSIWWAESAASRLPGRWLPRATVTAAHCCHLAHRDRLIS